MTEPPRSGRGDMGDQPRPDGGHGSSFQEMIARLERESKAAEQRSRRRPRQPGYDAPPPRTRAMFFLAGIATAVLAMFVFQSELFGGGSEPVPLAAESTTTSPPISTSVLPLTASTDASTTTTLPPTDADIATNVATALAGGGYPDVAVSVTGGLASLTGVVPIDALERGFFTYEASAKAIASGVSGVRGVQAQFRLRGDSAVLRSELAALVQQTPIEFASASADLTPAVIPVLDEAARLINTQPGLQILIAGHADPSGGTAANEQLSRRRAASVRDYLATQGVAVNRMVVVAYGELFPEAAQAGLGAARRVEFEVGS